MRNGAINQFMMTLKPICIQRLRWRKARCKVSNFTLQSIGYIITSKPIAVELVRSGLEERDKIDTHL